MFVDACAIIALLSNEDEAARVATAIQASESPFTSPVVVLEVVLALSRPDKFNIPIDAVENMVMEFLDVRNIEIRDLPPAKQAASLALSAAHRFRQGKHGLNLGDCLHYACARYYQVPILATHDEFKSTDLKVIP